MPKNEKKIIKNVHYRLRKKHLIMKLTTLICPTCGIGKLRIMKGEYLPFWSCDRYPICKMPARTLTRDELDDLKHKDSAAAGARQSNTEYKGERVDEAEDGQDNF